MLSAVRRPTKLVGRANPIGVARAILAVASLSTLLLSTQNALFIDFIEGAASARCVGIGQYGLFCVASEATGSQFAGTVIAIAVLLAVLSGYGARSLAIPHWYVAWSIAQNVVLVEGGDQVNAAVTMLLVPWIFVTARGNAWRRSTPYIGDLRMSAFSYGAAELIRVQLTLVYAIAAVAKFGVPQWAEGTALWYWLQVPTFGLSPDAFAAVAPVLKYPAVMVTATYAVMVFELALAVSIWTRGRVASGFLIAGIVFHAGIAVVLGLWSFGITMAAALLICRALQHAPVVFLSVSRRSIPSVAEGLLP